MVSLGARPMALEAFIRIAWSTSASHCDGPMYTKYTRIPRSLVRFLSLAQVPVLQHRQAGLFQLYSLLVAGRCYRVDSRSGQERY
jgi:hypothetical protein